MMDILFLTFIGQEIEIINATNPQLLGLKGKVIDETKNLIIIKTEKGVKKIPKTMVVIKFLEIDKIVNGWKICFRPHERPKKIKL